MFLCIFEDMTFIQFEASNRGQRMFVYCQYVSGMEARLVSLAMSTRLLQTKESTLRQTVSHPPVGGNGREVAFYQLHNFPAFEIEWRQFSKESVYFVYYDIGQVGGVVLCVETHA